MSFLSESGFFIYRGAELIEINQVSMKYGKTIALDKVSFKAEKGMILGLVGPNGAGKTTLMRILTTYLYPAEGTALIDGHDVTKDSIIARSLIGYMPETVPLYDDMIVDEYLTFIGRARGLFDDKLDEKLRWVKENCDLFPVWKHTISEISKGFRQRVGLAQALIHNPEVLILDEPMTGLDPLQIINIRKLIRDLKKEKTIIFSTHIFQEVEALADRIARQEEYKRSDIARAARGKEEGPHDYRNYVSGGWSGPGRKVDERRKAEEEMKKQIYL